MDQIRIKYGNAFIVPSKEVDYIYVTGENLLVEGFEEGDWYDLVRIDRTPNEKRWDKMVGKRRLLKLIEDNGGIPEDILRAYVYEVITEGSKAEEEYEEETGKKWDWDEYDREKEEIVKTILKLRKDDRWRFAYEGDLDN